jgi:hypothetical protein
VYFTPVTYHAKSSTFIQGSCRVPSGHFVGSSLLGNPHTHGFGAIDGFLYSLSFVSNPPNVMKDSCADAVPLLIA